jgi:uncharacterized protein (TIGR01777 family)
VKIAITGASGLIGRRLLKALAAEGHTLHVLSRHAGTNLPAGVKLSAWDPVKGEPPAEALENTDAVIHLAGEPVAQRWTTDTKRQIRESRVTGTRNLVQAFSRLCTAPKTLISASAVGYYGSRGDEILMESSAPGSGYLAEVCVEWEREAQSARAAGVRVVPVRIGVVLDPRGGALQKMLPPFRMGVGGKIAGGRHWMSWIHIDDLVGIMIAALSNSWNGPVNGVSPQPVTNADFTQALARAVKRPAIFPVPAAGLKLLFGEMSEVLLASQRVVPNQAESAGFRFRFPELSGALTNLLK